MVLAIFAKRREAAQGEEEQEGCKGEEMSESSSSTLTLTRSGLVQDVEEELEENDNQRPT
jgi:hypothetical protein